MWKVNCTSVEQRKNLSPHQGIEPTTSQTLEGPGIRDVLGSIPVKE